jgi:hypothetical protein
VDDLTGYEDSDAEIRCIRKKNKPVAIGKRENQENADQSLKSNGHTNSTAVSVAGKLSDQNMTNSSNTSTKSNFSFFKFFKKRK